MQYESGTWSPYLVGIMLPDLLGMRLAVFLAVIVPLLVLGLLVVAQLAP